MRVLIRIYELLSLCLRFTMPEDDLCNMWGGNWRVCSGHRPKLPFHACSTQEEIVCVRCILTYWKYLFGLGNMCLVERAGGRT